MKKEENRKFQIWKTIRIEDQDINFAKLSFEDLGLNPTEKYKEIREVGLENGLELCIKGDEEYLCSQVFDQPKKERLLIIMEPFLFEGNERITTLENDDKLKVSMIYPYSYLFADYKFIFRIL